MRPRRNRRRPFDPSQVPDSLLGPGRTMPTGVEGVQALADYLEQHDALDYGDDRPGRIHVLSLFVHLPGEKWDDLAARYLSKENS